MTNLFYKYDKWLYFMTIFIQKDIENFQSSYCNKTIFFIVDKLVIKDNTWHELKCSCIYYLNYRKIFIQMMSKLGQIKQLNQAYTQVARMNISNLLHQRTKSLAIAPHIHEMIYFVIILLLTFKNFTLHKQPNLTLIGYLPLDVVEI